MNIILIPGNKHGKGRNATLSPRHLWVMAAVGLVGLPLLLGSIAYRVHALLDRTAGPQALLVAQERALTAQRASIEEAKRHTRDHLNALARRMGQLQAEVLRLNALGARLTRMAGLDAREFNFEAEVAMGGPERAAPAALPTPDAVKSLERLSAEIDHARERLIALESLLLDRRLSDAITPSGWPVEGGWVSSGFGLRADPFTGAQAWHEGVDVAARLGGPIFAMAEGVVSHAAEKAGYGLMVEVTHESGLITRYAHTAATLVKVGDRVTRGQAIARVGSSGRSTGPHVHFEVVKDGRAVNPGRYLRWSERH